MPDPVFSIRHATQILGFFLKQIFGLRVHLNCRLPPDLGVSCLLFLSEFDVFILGHDFLPFSNLVLPAMPTPVLLTPVVLSLQRLLGPVSYFGGATTQSFLGLNLPDPRMR
jgi:hypothetical protein